MNVRHSCRDVAVGLDVGTTKICALIGRRDNGRIEIISAGSSPSTGLRKGIVIDTDVTADSIRRTLTEAENTAGLGIRSVYVGIAGGHIKGFNGHGVIGIKGRKVREEDVERLIDSAGAVYVPVDREILHVIPAGFRLDGHNGIKDPVGMTGDRLEADVHIVTGAVASVRNLVRCCEIAGVETADIVLEPLASAESVLSADEKVKGVALVDIGGGTTDIAVYKDRVLRHTAVLALGGNHITNDIAVGLGLSVAEAERIKKAYGCVVEGMVHEKGGIDASDTGSRMMKIPERSLVEIIHPRCEELMSLIKKEIWISQKHMKETSFGSGVSGVVLTGGTSLLRGIDMMAEEIFGLPVRIGIPDSTGDISVKSPVYSTGVGLIAYGLDRSEKQGEMRSEKALTSRDIFERMKYWVGGFF